MSPTPWPALLSVSDVPDAHCRYVADDGSWPGLEQVYTQLRSVYNIIRGQTDPSTPWPSGFNVSCASRRGARIHIPPHADRLSNCGHCQDHLRHMRIP